MTMVARQSTSERRPIHDIRLFEKALPGPLFERIARAVRDLGDERLKRNYNTTFWFPRAAAPRNIAEETVIALIGLVDPPDDCVGTEWWLGRLGYGEKLRLHFDRDLSRSRKFGEHEYPLFSSILYLNDFPSSPTVVLGQVPGQDPRTKVPKKPEFKEAIEAVSNRYAVFPGNLLHGVKPIPDSVKASGQEKSAMRLSLLVNYWRRRPMLPICRDYDGSIYKRF